MHRKLVAVPASILAAGVVAVIMSTSALAQDTEYHVTTGFNPNQAVVGGQNEGCVISGQKLTHDGFTCDTAPAAPVASAITLKTDELFETAKSVLRNTSGIDSFASRIRGLKTLRGISVTGHADYRGEEAYNQRLSEHRAAAVARQLIRNQIPQSWIRAVGEGESRPVVGQTGCSGMKGSALSACLAPDRRVTIEVIGATR